MSKIPKDNDDRGRGKRGKPTGKRGKVRRLLKPLIKELAAIIEAAEARPEKEREMLRQADKALRKGSENITAALSARS